MKTLEVKMVWELKKAKEVNIAKKFMIIGKNKINKIVIIIKKAKSIKKII